jgi:glycosyltransferase involved in cell wall biosynthesis
MLKAIRIAVFLENTLLAGGNHQQPLNAASLIRSIPGSIADVIFVVTDDSNRVALKELGADSILYNPSAFSRTWLKMISLLPYGLLKYLRKLVKHNSLERFLNKHKINLVYFPSQSGLAACLETTNYIYTLYDLCHRDYPEFPEVRSHRQFESRELHFRRILPKAFAVLCESELGRTNAINRYGLEPTRVHVFPSSPAFGIKHTDNVKFEKVLDIKKQYQLDCDYIFYPAQFWAHKNHTYILQGMKSLELNYGTKISAIFSGGDKGNMNYVKQVAEDLGILDRVRFAGFVSNSQMKFLYKQSIALVMPTYFGPTNLPPLEAFYLGVPVLYSDLPGLREQVGDAALLLDLNAPECLALNLNNLMADCALRRVLIERGYKRLIEIDNSMPKQQVITSILNEFYRHRICWE